MKRHAVVRLPRERCNLIARLKLRGRKREIYKSDVGVVRSGKRARRKMRDVSRQIEMGQHRAIRFWIVLKMFSCKTMERGHFPRRDSDTSATSFLLSNEYLNIWCEELRILICLYIYFIKIFFIILFFCCMFFFFTDKFLFIYFFLLLKFLYLIFFLKFSSCLLFIVIISLRFNSIARCIFQLKYFISYKLEFYNLIS